MASSVEPVRHGAGQYYSWCEPTCTMPTLDCTASWISLLHRFTISAFHCSTCPALTSTADATTGACGEWGQRQGEDEGMVTQCITIFAKASHWSL